MKITKSRYKEISKHLEGAMPEIDKIISEDYDNPNIKQDLINAKKYILDQISKVPSTDENFGTNLAKPLAFYSAYISRLGNLYPDVSDDDVQESIMSDVKDVKNALLKVIDIEPAYLDIVSSPALDDESKINILPETIQDNMDYDEASGYFDEEFNNSYLKIKGINRNTLSPKKEEEKEQVVNLDNITLKEYNDSCDKIEIYSREFVGNNDSMSRQYNVEQFKELLDDCTKEDAIAAYCVLRNMQSSSGFAVSQYEYLSSLVSKKFNINPDSLNLVSCQGVPNGAFDELLPENASDKIDYNRVQEKCYYYDVQDSIVLGIVNRNLSNPDIDKVSNKVSNNNHFSIEDVEQQKENIDNQQIEENEWSENEHEDEKDEQLNVEEDVEEEKKVDNKDNKEYLESEIISDNKLLDNNAEKFQEKEDKQLNNEDKKEYLESEIILDNQIVEEEKNEVKESKVEVKKESELIEEKQEPSPFDLLLKDLNDIKLAIEDTNGIENVISNQNEKTLSIDEEARKRANDIRSKEIKGISDKIDKEIRSGKRAFKFDKDFFNGHVKYWIKNIDANTKDGDTPLYKDCSSMIEKNDALLETKEDRASDALEAYMLMKNKLNKRTWGDIFGHPIRSIMENITFNKCKETLNNEYKLNDKTLDKLQNWCLVRKQIPDNFAIIDSNGNMISSTPSNKAIETQKQLLLKEQNKGKAKDSLKDIEKLVDMEKTNEISQGIDKTNTKNINKEYNK